ncbi:uncharacterized protein CBL_10848 [Carabus blaptoides fortunei]
MKFVFVLALICFASAKSVQPEPKYDHTLEESLKAFVDIIDLNKVLSILLEGLSSDEEVIQVIEFMQGPEFTNIVVTVQDMKEYQDTLLTLYNLGLDVYYYLNAIHEILGLPPIHHPDARNGSRTLIGFFEKLTAALPLDELRVIYEDKMKNDEVFIIAMETIGSKEFRRIGDVVMAMPEFTTIMNKLEEAGIDSKKLLEIIMDFFGW